MAKYMINEMHTVEDAGAAKTFGKGEKRTDYADAWKETGNAILIGLSGSGKAVLAGLLAQRTGQTVITPTDAVEAKAALEGEGHIIVLDDALVEDEAIRPLIHDAGKGFYLMADSSVLSARVAEREGVEDRDSLWRETSARLAVMEPVFYGVLHFILQAGKEPEAMVDDALEKLTY